MCRPITFCGKFSFCGKFPVFNYITTGAFTPLVKHDFQMNWALLIIIKKSTLLKKLHLPAFSYPLAFSIFHLLKVRTGTGVALKGWALEHPRLSGSRQLSNPSWIGREKLKYLSDTDQKLIIVAKI
jgi:hypothetical protein